LVFFDPAIFLAAAGITTLEIVEAAAVGLALYADTGKSAAFLYVIAGIVAVMIPTLIVGSAIGLLPPLGIKVVGGALLLYFGIRLIRSARRSVVIRKTIGFKGGSHEEIEKGLFYTAFSVGAIEAFEAAIVLVGLLPENYNSTLIGIGLGVAVVVAATYILKTQVRKVKQANMKVIVSAILLSFAALWVEEAFSIVLKFTPVNDLILIPLFVIFFVVVYAIANRPVHRVVAPTQ
jgi:uncharacterized membrane protein